MKSLFYVGFVSFVFCCDGNYFCRLLRHFLCLHLYCVNSDTLFRLHSQGARKHLFFQFLALKAPIATKVVCFSRLLNCLRSLYDKQYGPKNIKQSFAADDVFRCFFFLGASRVRYGKCSQISNTFHFPDGYQGWNS